MLPAQRATPSLSPSSSRSTIMSSVVLSSAEITSRPKLKRQYTAPAFTQRSSPKKLRVFGGLDQTKWSDEEHTAFLDALRVFPAGTALACRDHEDTRYERISKYIHNETGKTRTVEQVFQHMSTSSRSTSIMSNSSPVQAPSLPKVVAPGSTHADNAFSANPQALQIEPLKLVATTHASLMYISPVSPIQPTTATPSALVSFTTVTTSMSQRRRASNRPIPKLHVNIPPTQMPTSLATLFQSPSETRVAAKSLVTPQSSTATSWFLPTLDRSSSSTSIPVTPIGQRIKTPLAPPEIPRMIGSTRRGWGGSRWAPTPTEELFPTVSYATVTTSCALQAMHGDGRDGERRSPGPAANSLSWFTHRAISTDAPARRHYQPNLASPAVIGTCNSGHLAPPRSP